MHCDYLSNYSLYTVRLKVGGAESLLPAPLEKSGNFYPNYQTLKAQKVKTSHFVNVYPYSSPWHKKFVSYEHTESGTVYVLPCSHAQQ